MVVIRYLAMSASCVRASLSLLQQLLDCSRILARMNPSRARYTLLRFAFALSVVTYLDRVCIATAATSIRSDLHLDTVQMGWVFSAFTLAYAIFEIPSG